METNQDSYFLFVNWFGCCAGIDSSYEIHVGRSSSRTGPYLDRDGVEMTNGGVDRWKSANTKIVRRVAGAEEGRPIHRTGSRCCL